MIFPNQTLWVKSYITIMNLKFSTTNYLNFETKPWENRDIISLSNQNKMVNDWSVHSSLHAMKFGIWFIRYFQKPWREGGCNFLAVLTSQMNLHTSLDGFWKSEMKTLVLLEPALELLDFWNQQNIEKTLIYSRIFLHKIITKHIGFSTSSIRIHPNFPGRSATRKSYSEFREVIATNQPQNINC